MKRKFEIFGLCIGWFAVLSQFILMFQNRQADIFETLIRFFSFFTILTNTLVSLYFTSRVIKAKKFILNDGAITALTVFILIVGLVYQLLLRGLWQPTGLQYVVDELLHTIVPIYMLGYWFFHVKKSDLKPKKLFIYLLYPIIYIAFILLRGGVSNYYPYPFLNVGEIGYEKALANIAVILALSVILSIVLIFLGKFALKVRGDE